MSRVLLLLAVVASWGCGIGHNRTLFFTTSNLGLAVDTTPPTAELSISRRENVIGPTFEGGIKPPVLASFRSSVRGILGVFADVSSTFAGGDTAETLGKLFDDAYSATSTVVADSTRCVSAPPDPKFKVPGPGEVKPFVFGTDTAFGLKVSWSGATAQYPDSVKLGYNRKEWALASIHATPASAAEGRVAGKSNDGARNGVTFDDGRVYALRADSQIVRGGQLIGYADVSTGDRVAIYRTFLASMRNKQYVPASPTAATKSSPCGWGEWEIHMPSFLATVDHGTRVGSPRETGTEHVQLFATGAAANNLALRDEVRKTMIARLDPKVAARLKSFKAGQTTQIDLVKSIQTTFDAKSATGQDSIVAKAKPEDLDLVPAATTRTTFKGNLSDKVDGSDDTVTARLEKLKVFAESVN